jgi:hypothetical protein
VNLRDAYTKIFLKQQNQTTTKSNVKQATLDIWQNSRTKNLGGLRLSDFGYKLLTEKLELASYEVPFPLELEMTAQVIIFLDRFLDCPYYLTKNSIIVFKERKAFDLHLFNGDVRKYGLTKAMSNQKVPK